MMAATRPIDLSYRLEDRYERRSGRVYLNGSQALVLLPLLQRERDRQAGLNTACYISGYTGSPLGGYDLALQQARERLEAEHIVFQPGVNEDLAATAVWGSQQTEWLPGARHDGVFALWYGKGPGVDRSGDALKHGSLAGAARHGGVLVLAGDDHGARSSTTAHQSDLAFQHFSMPYFNPATVQDYLDLGLHGLALSRYSGCWIGMKCVTDTIESSASVEADPHRVKVQLPEDPLPEKGLNLRWGITPREQEERQQLRLAAVRHYARLNRLDRALWLAPEGRLGIVSTGKAMLDVRQALEGLGLTEDECRKLGVSLYQVAMPWPLEPEGALEFCLHHHEVLVVEEKQPVIEDQLARLLYDQPERPVLTGKRDHHGKPLLPITGELDPTRIGEVLQGRLAALGQDGKLSSVPREEVMAVPTGPVRLPAFCAGCPHNTSTRLPEGSVAFGGIGCHGMAVWLPDRPTLSLTHMGGEGAPWLGMAPFTDTPHLFQNLGDGTYFHSGLLAIRAAAAAGVNITYKILVNDAIAMTGGQAIPGQVDVAALSRQVHAEGARRIAVVSNAPERLRSLVREMAPGVTLHHRDELDAVQRQFREHPGLSVILYQQECATELRRRRRRGLAEDPDRRLFIHPLVCEGCGDCGVQSNCIALEPEETEFGRKRKINQSACNKDESCLKGYCPSFVTVRGARPRQRQGVGDERIHQRVAGLPAPEVASDRQPYNILVSGIGGYGVITLGALLGMAAHLEGKGCSVLDVAGLAQRNGAVTSHVRIGRHPELLHSTRIAARAADLAIGCDIVVAAATESLGKYQPQRTRAVINTRVAPTSAFAQQPDMDLSAETMVQTLHQKVNAESEFIEAGSLAYALMGDAVAANLFLVGLAAQKGWLPVSLEALEQAIQLNGIAVEMNRAALAWGRLAAVDPEAVRKAAGMEEQIEEGEKASLEDLVESRSAFLADYQHARYAEQYRELVEHVAEVEAERLSGREELARAVAHNLFRLMSYKDEYEVARLHTQYDIRDYLKQEFEGDFYIEYHMAPPILGGRDPRTGRYPKRRLGPWVRVLLVLLARARPLRGTPLDLFGWSRHRRRERALIRQYREMLEEILVGLSEGNHDLAVELARLPEEIRGFDVVKERHMDEVQQRQEVLMRQFRGGGDVVQQYQPDTLIATIR